MFQGSFVALITPLKDGKVDAYRTKVQISFKYEGQH